jgi:hypothetical protein
VTGTGTLALAWNIAPTSAATASAIVKRDATGSFSAGTINATTVNAGFASLAGIGVTSSSPIPTYFYSSATDADTLWGVAGSSTGNAVGVEGETSSSGGSGVYGTADSTTGSANGVYGIANADGSGVLGVNTSSGPGVSGHSAGGWGMITDSNVSQSRSMGGWAKAMVLVDPGNGGIQVCFNSQLAASLAAIPPCGITYSRPVSGYYILDFGFQVTDRFYSLTPVYTNYTSSLNNILTGCSGDPACGLSTSTQVAVFVGNSSTAPDQAFYLIMF